MEVILFTFLFKYKKKRNIRSLVVLVDKDRN